jgi:hypothetical protein
MSSDDSRRNKQQFNQLEDRMVTIERDLSVLKENLQAIFQTLNKASKCCPLLRK